MKRFKRIRRWMDITERFVPGLGNRITDVPGVTVGHCTLIQGDNVRTGVTVVRQHPGNVFLYRTPAAVYSANGHTKAAGTLQVEELGELESYIALTNTLSVGAALQGLIEYHKRDMGTLEFKSINGLVCETNDGQLSDILGGHVRPEHVLQAIEAARTEVEEGAVGAGTGCTCYGYKGGIGTASRVIPAAVTGEAQEYIVGVLVQSNFGGNLNMYGHALPLRPLPLAEVESTARGSVSVIVATDAPMSELQLRRLAKRAMLGIAATGSYMGNSSGDLALAFSNCPQNLRDFTKKRVQRIDALSNEQLNPFFEAAMDAAREAVYNSLCMARDMEGCGKQYEGFDITRFADRIPLYQEGEEAKI